MNTQISFKEWLAIKENMTSTSGVVSFKRMVISNHIRRALIGPWGEDLFFKKRKSEGKVLGFLNDISYK